MSHALLDARREIAILRARLDMLLDGPGLCLEAQCVGHCGYWRLSGCQAIKAFLADCRRDEE